MSPSPSLSLSLSLLLSLSAWAGWQQPSKLSCAVCPFSALFVAGRSRKGCQERHRQTQKFSFNWATGAAIRQQAAVDARRLGCAQAQSETQAQSESESRAQTAGAALALSLRESHAKLMRVFSSCLLYLNVYSVTLTHTQAHCSVRFVCELSVNWLLEPNEHRTRHTPRMRNLINLAPGTG